MNAVMLFLMLRERLSHSLVDGRLLTAAGPNGDDGLRRILEEPMILEEFVGRLSGLTRIGRTVLGLQNDKVWDNMDAEIRRQVRVLREAASGNSTKSGCIRGAVLEVRELLRELGGESFSARAVLATVARPPWSYERRTAKIVGLIAQALDSDLSQVETAELARVYWVERLAVEEEIIAASLFVVNGAVAVSDSIEDVLWALRGFDDVAELAISCTSPRSDRHASCEKILIGSTPQKLRELDEHTANLVRRLIDSRG